MDEIKLKPCPFCGGKAIANGINIAWVRCSECGSETAVYGSAKKAKEAWNRRADNG